MSPECSEMSPECSQMSPECSEMFFRPRQMSGASQKAAKMTAGRREFVGENRTAAGEIPIYIGMVKNDGGEGE